MSRYLALLVLPLLLLTACGNDADDADLTDRMAEEHDGDTPSGNDVAWLEPAQPVSGETVTYADVNGNAVTGYLATPDGATGNLPGVIVIHEWWGLNDNMRAMARRLAGEGYAALAVDLYGGNVAATPDSAMAFMRAVSNEPAPARDNLMQAYRFLTEQRGADNVGVIGWCFGGGWSLRTALMLPDGIDAMVMYYGQVVTDAAQLATLNMPVLGIFAEDDQGIPVQQVRQFQTALDTLGKQADIQIYDNVGHAFANPSGERYAPEAAQDAWSRTRAFFAQHLKGGS